MNRNVTGEFLDYIFLQTCYSIVKKRCKVDNKYFFLLWPQAVLQDTCNKHKHIFYFGNL